MNKIAVQLHSGQARAWRSNKKVVAIISGTGSGKTFFGPIWLYREVQRNPQGSFLVVSPTYLMYERVVLPTFRAFFDQAVAGTYKYAERAYYLPTGGRIYFGSADNPYSLEGVHINAAWLDEAGQMKREAWEVVLRRTAFHKGRILITTTPYNLGWLKTEVYDRWAEGDPDIEVVQFASVENPFYPREEFERARKVLPEWKFRMFFMGHFARPEGVIYDFDPTTHIVEPFEIPKDWVRIMGVDFGYNNPTAVVWIARDHDSNFYIYREYYKRHKTFGEVAQEVAKLSEGETIAVAYCDPSEPVAIEELVRAGIPATPADNEVMAGISVVQQLFRENRIRVFRGLSNFLDEIASYHWDEKKEQPLKEYDHLMDATRYAIYSYTRIGEGIVAFLI